MARARKMFVIVRRPPYKRVMSIQPAPRKTTTVKVTLRLERPYAAWLSKKACKTKISQKKIVQRALDCIAKDDLTSRARELAGLSPVEIALEKNRV